MTPSPAMPETTAPRRQMPTLFLGVKAQGWDAAFFAVDPEQRAVFGMSVERISRYKHDPLPPTAVLERLIEAWNIDPAAVETIHLGGCLALQGGEVIDPNALEYKMLLRPALGARYLGEYKEKFEAFGKMTPDERLALLSSTPAGQEMMRRFNAPRWPTMLTCAGYIAAKVGEVFPNAKVVFTPFDHEYCHAVSSYFTAPFPAGLLITMDGLGDDNVFSRAYRASAAGIYEIARSRTEVEAFNFGGDGDLAMMAASVGGIYSWFTWLLGFPPHSDEGKVEALAAYGRPIPDLLDALMGTTIVDDVSAQIRLDKAKIESLLAYRQIKPVLDQHSREDVAATVQAYLERVVVAYVRRLVEKTGEKRIMLSGGVFANVILNLRLFEGVTQEIFVTPAMADDGATQGACYLTLLTQGYSIPDLEWLKGLEMPYFGTAQPRDRVRAALEAAGDAIEWTDLGDAWPERCAELLDEHKIGAIFHGKMEWGPRALGNRSIIADPRSADVRDRLNREIKRRPGFQPFCPSILLEEKDRLFAHAYANPHMTCAFRMRPEFHAALPGAIHVDGTARAQFVTATGNPAYWRLISAFKARSGYGVVINTSFNKHGRTIVEQPEHAVTDFLDTDLPFLCIEGFLVTRKPTVA